MATSVNPLEDHLTCSVCLEVYTDPYALRCLHTFCYQCIQGLKQGIRVQCPECRDFTDFSEVKKDFKMQSLLEINRNTAGNDSNRQEAICDLCEDPTKTVQSFCTKCDDCLCVNCSNARRKSKATEDDKLINFEFEKSKRQEMDKYMQTLADEEREMEGKCTKNVELIDNIKQAAGRQMAEVNRLRQSIIDDINNHHDSLLSEIEAINQDTIRSLEQQRQMFAAAKQQLADKKQFIADVSQTTDIALLTDTLKHLNSNFREELTAIRSKLPRFDENVKSSVRVVEGNGWNPSRSTRIEMAGTAAVETKVAGPRRNQPANELQRKEIHPRYREVKSAAMFYDPLKVCVCRDELWVAGGDKGVCVYGTDLQQTKQITDKHFKQVTGVFRTESDVIVSDAYTGLHVLNERGDYLKHICSGEFSDASVNNNNTLFGLGYKKQKIYVFSKPQKKWEKVRKLNLSGYRDSCAADRLCTTGSCIYVSSYNTHCVRLYSLTGDFLYKTGEWGEGVGLEAGKFCYPILSDVDSEGKLLLCDHFNNRLQVFDPQTRQWSVVQGLEGLKQPMCAGVGHKHLWVGDTYGYEFWKYEAQ